MYKYVNAFDKISQYPNLTPDNNFQEPSQMCLLKTPIIADIPTPTPFKICNFMLCVLRNNTELIVYIEYSKESIYLASIS